MKKNEARSKAVELGEKRYHGTPCRNCRNTLRNVCDSGCVECNKERARNTQAQKRADGRNKPVRQRYEQGAAGKAARKRYNATITDEMRRDSQLKSLYGITFEQYQHMHKEQQGKCKICGKEESVSNRSLAVDHCHNSGIIRGLLCLKCNTGLGKFRDDPILLQRAIEYLI